MMGLGTQEIILILLVVLIFFGAKKIPELARGFGKGVSEFKKGMSEVQNELNKDTTDSKPEEKK
ncbi:MAG: twin-arginine translocase TatA/TatE family subunit [Bacteriovoracaceae bacterium]|nr:twin-arginine translocase TatA/TatE family subunit [Bacteroidota bacterium]